MRDTMTLHLQRCSRERTSCGSALLPSNRQRAAASGISDSRDTVRQSRIQTRSEPMLRVSRFCPEHFGRVRSAGPPARGQVACVTLSCEQRQPRLTERSSRIRLADATAEETGQAPTGSGVCIPASYRRTGLWRLASRFPTPAEGSCVRGVVARVVVPRRLLQGVRLPQLRARLKARRLSLLAGGSITLIAVSRFHTSLRLLRPIWPLRPGHVVGLLERAVSAAFDVSDIGAGVYAFAFLSGSFRHCLLLEVVTIDLRNLYRVKLLRCTVECGARSCSQAVRIIVVGCRSAHSARYPATGPARFSSS